MNNIHNLNPDNFNFAPVMNYNDQWKVLDLRNSYPPPDLEKGSRGIGRYNEKRKNMYNAPQYEGKRNIHMGIDLWAPSGEPVYAFYDGQIRYFRDNDEKGNYGPTIVTSHRLNDITLFALFGHLSRTSLGGLSKGGKIKRGEKIGELGSSEENGGWVPHLHFQLSLEDPGEADMPGVVADENREEALRLYPDPRIVLGNLY